MKVALERHVRERAVPPPMPVALANLAGLPPEVELSFRRFREASVQLIEDVSDLLDGAGTSAIDSEQDSDLSRVRAIFGKWSADILLTLHRSPASGFEELRRALGGISARVLSIKLKELEEIGMVTRKVLDSRPPRALYGLTERGWTVTWLAQPILLYIRLTYHADHRRTSRAPRPAREAPPDMDPPSA